MKKIFLSLLLSACSLYSFSQHTEAENLGTKTLYNAPEVKLSPVPASYKAVYINHIGRHGARHLTKDIRKSYAYEVIDRADSLNALTAAGKELKQMILNLGREEAGHTASISTTGENELKGIAMRMYDQQKEIFTGGNPIVVSTTNKGRTKESATAFLTGLKSKEASAVSKVTFNYADDDHLRFYDFSKNYDEFKNSGSWTKDYQKLAAAKHLNDIALRFTAKIFKPTFLPVLKPADRIEFVNDVYGFYAILAALDTEIKAVGLQQKELNFRSLFRDSDLAALSILGDAEDFLTKGPGMDKNGIQVRIAAPLLIDFLNTTDTYIQSKTVNANLRFAHAETVAPFAALMDIKGASETAWNILSFNKTWQADQVIPLSANIQWIVYQDTTSGNYLVKFLLNEKEVAINGMQTSTFPYYNWTTVREFYLKKLKSMNLDLQSDVHGYLIQLK